MKQLWILILFLYACANPIPPTGGPKDLDPPNLINTIPENKTLNFEGSEIVLEFDEYIKEENLLTQLMITPNLSAPYAYQVNRTQIKLSFEEPFDSSTTYTFNFREGLKDITEGNVPPNLKFVFSTGTFLDSASVHGNVQSLMTKKSLEDITISLYSALDTVTFLDGPPRYSTLTNEEGNFSLENVKNGTYSIFSLSDENRNLELESRSEMYGFLDHPIELNDSMAGLNMFVYNLDTRPIVLQNSRPVGNNFDLKFNKSLASYKLITDDETIVSNFVEKNETLRIYYNPSITDSLGLRFIVEDSLRQTIDSLVYVKFSEATKKPDKFSSSLNLSDGPVNRSISSTLKFNKPIMSINYDSIYFEFDSISSIPATETMFSPNSSNDEYIFSVDFDELLANDSALINWPGNFYLRIGAAAFISVENDSITVIKRELSFKSPKEYGIIRGTINTDFSSFFIQLVDNKFEVIEEKYLSSTNNKSYEFLHIKPGSYSIRVLVDENNNGQWDPGNIKLAQLPEKVALFFHPNVTNQAINLRANWEQAGLELSF